MEYNQFKIKRYDNWDLFLHINQFPYLGRCYAWALRDEAKRITDMNELERNELFGKVIPEWENAVKELFNHDWSNVASLGNTSPHLHWHLIPRFNTSRKINEIEFVDPNPKGNYAPYLKKELPLEMLLKIKDEIRFCLEKYS